MLKTPGSRTTFGGSDVEKVHGVVARSTFRSQNVKNTRISDHFWRFRCGFAWQAQGIVHLVKSEQNARVFVAFSTTTTTTSHYTPIHYTTQQLQLQLHLHYIPLHYTALNYTQLHYTTLHYTPLHYITLHYNYNSATLRLQLQLHYTTLHPAVVGEVTTATNATTPKKHNSNHFSVHQWIRSAIHASQQLNSLVVSYR